MVVVIVKLMLCVCFNVMRNCPIKSLEFCDK